MTSHRSHRWPLVGALVAVTLMGAACTGSSDRKVAVTAVDFRFIGLPATLKPGSVLTLTNTSTREIHELVAVRLPDSERRSVDEIARLPEDQLGNVFPPGLPALVLLAPPNRAPQILAVGDGSLKERGRYFVFCAVPAGANPAAFIEASLKAAKSDTGPPQVAGGPPHFADGMYAQVIVK